MTLLKLEEYYTSSISLFRTVLGDCDGAESEVATLEALEIRTGHRFATTPDYPTTLLQRRYRT